MIKDVLSRQRSVDPTLCYPPGSQYHGYPHEIYPADMSRHLPAPHSGKDGPTMTSVSTGESTLSCLTEKFIELLHHSSRMGDAELDLNTVVREMGIQKRRLYDITNVLEGVGLITKDRNQVSWAESLPIKTRTEQKTISLASEKIGQNAVSAEIEELKQHEKFIDECILALSNSVREYTKCPKESTQTALEKGGKEIPAKCKLFVTKRDIAELQAYHNDTVIAIRAPSGTSLEVPNPDEGMRLGMRRFQIFLTSPGKDAGPVKVEIVQNLQDSHRRRHPSSYYDYNHRGPPGYWGNYPPHFDQASVHPNFPPAVPKGQHPPFLLPIQAARHESKLDIYKPDLAAIRSDPDISSSKVSSNINAVDLSCQKDIKMAGLPQIPLSNSLTKTSKMSRSKSSPDCLIGKKDVLLPPRPNLKRRSSEAWDEGLQLDKSEMEVPRMESLGGGRKPLKAALKKSPAKKKRSKNENKLFSPKITPASCFPEPQSPIMRSPMKKRPVYEAFTPGGYAFTNTPGGNLGALTPGGLTPGRNDLLTAPLHSPFPNSFLRSPVYSLSSPKAGSKAGSCNNIKLASPFPFSSPGANMMLNQEAEFSPLIQSPYLGKMEIQLDSDKDLPLF